MYRFRHGAALLALALVFLGGVTPAGALGEHPFRTGVLTCREGHSHGKPDATVTMSKTTPDKIGLRQLDFPTALKQGEVKLEGDGARLTALMGMFGTFAPMFDSVTP